MFWGGLYEVLGQGGGETMKWRGEDGWDLELLNPARLKRPADRPSRTLKVIW
jgi:hypothetical protein